MALNLGPEAFEAIVRLKNNSDWRAFVNSLHDQMSEFMHRALEAPVDSRVDATGFARGLCEILKYIDLVEKPENRNPRPKVRMREGVNV
jgi:hypothetical protein